MKQPRSLILLLSLALVATLLLGAMGFEGDAAALLEAGPETAAPVGQAGAGHGGGGSSWSRLLLGTAS